MFKDITLGQYYKADSIIHRLDARTKLIITLVFAILIFLCRDVWTFGIAVVFLGTYVGLSKVPLKFILRGMKFIWFFVIISSILNLFSGDGEAIWSIWNLSVTWDGIYTALIVAGRLLFLIVGSSIMTYTTKPMDMTDGVEHLLKWLKVFHVPVTEIAMIMTIALRFIPILMEELDKIRKAQMSRGADFESGNVFVRVKSYIPVFIPLFVSGVRRANALALAMDSRCYQGGETRTKLYPLNYSLRDGIAFVLMLMFVLSIIICRCII